MSPVAREHSFDELTRGMASGSISRGKALKLMGAALVGGTLASIPGTAWAARCPSPRIRCRGQCCATGVTTCVGTGRNKTCGPCPSGTGVCGGTCVPNVCFDVEPFNPELCRCEPICDPPCATDCDCRTNPDGMGTTCVSEIGLCANDCSVCEERGLGETCVRFGLIGGCPFLCSDPC
jgi:hypothetical protein